MPTSSSSARSSVAGCKKIFPVSAFTGEGIPELVAYLEDDEDRARRLAEEEKAKKAAKKAATSKKKKETKDE